MNLNGEYNVPFGHRSTRVLDASNLRLVSDRLQNCELTSSDFTAAARSAGEGDLVFLDPPYTVSHNHNGFIKYNQKLFSMEDQHRLASLVDRLREVGANYILTNAAHPTIAALFDRGESRYELTRTNVIGGLQAARGRSSEYVFTNAF